jgi:hypothetical protein
MEYSLGNRDLRRKNVSKELERVSRESKSISISMVKSSALVL